MRVTCIGFRNLILALGLAFCVLFLMPADPDAGHLSKWWAVYGLAFALACLSASHSARSRFRAEPKINPFLYLSLLLLLVGAAFHPATVFDFHRFLFALVVISVVRFSFDRQKLFNAMAIALAASQALFFLQTALSYPLNLLSLSDENALPLLAGSFGNANMASEFFVFCIPFFLAEAAKNRRAFFWTAFIALDLCYLWLLRSRSAELAAASALIAAFALSRKELKKPQFFAVFAGLGGLGFFLWSSLGSLAKNASFTDRKTLFHDTWRLFLDRPLGIGRSEFLFRFPQYQSRVFEKEIYLGPHDEFLRIIAEDGILWFLGAAIATVFLLVRARNLNPSSRLLICTFGLVLSVQMLFQFPFDNAVSSLLIAIVLGSILSDGSQGESPSFLQQMASNRWTIAAISAATIGLGCGYVKADYATLSGSQDLQALEEACHDVPLHPRACVELGNQLLSHGEFKRCIDKLQPLLARYPYYPSYLRILGACEIESGDLENGCDKISRYLKRSPEPEIAEHMRLVCAGAKKLNLQ